ncbi:MAG: dihydropteroate synthase, partial [Dehalococcoidales bacterium]
MKTALSPTKCGSAEFRWGEKTYIMGIVNLSPGSFSGDGIGDDIERTVDQAQHMVEEGADIIDVGGESTRPGTAPMAIDDFEEELSLIIPAIERLVKEISVPI